MTYGDGEGGTKALTSLDIIGHEMTHGVTSNTANLNYTGESGGLNEATSDIFGTGVEFYAANSSDVGDYLVGEEVDINGDGTPLRYMDEPDKDGSSADSWYSGIGNLDVHYSSGPANHMFYLLSEGSGSKTVNGVTYNSPTSDGVAVAGIGRAAALQIWYKALTTYMTSSTTYRRRPHRRAQRRRGPVRHQLHAVRGGRQRLRRDQRRQPHHRADHRGHGHQPGQPVLDRRHRREPADLGLQHQQRLADLRRERPAHRPVDQQLHRCRLRHPDHGQAPTAPPSR